MIESYTGTPGSGKTSHSINDIQKYLARGSVVVCNFAIDLSKIPFVKKSSKFVEIDPSSDIDKLYEYAQYSKGEDSLLLVLDEAQLIFNSRNWSDASRKKWISFFSQHRKLGYRVILITQDINMLDRQIRMLVENNVVHRRMNQFGFVSKIMSALFLNRLFVFVNYWAPRNMRISSGTFLLMPWMTKAYNTNAILDRKEL